MLGQRRSPLLVRCRSNIFDAGPTLKQNWVIVIVSSYFISGFGAGNKMIDLYVILAMPFISFLVVVIYIIGIPSFYFGNAT